MTARFLPAVTLQLVGYPVKRPSRSKSVREVKSDTDNGEQTPPSEEQKPEQPRESVATVTAPIGYKCDVPAEITSVTYAEFHHEMPPIDLPGDSCPPAFAEDEFQPPYAASLGTEVFSSAPAPRDDPVAVQTLASFRSQEADAYMDSLVEHHHHHHCGDMS